ncbi:MAG: penicillin-binding transpeptidase domain-containing protein [Clostridia bacterium]|nr:penicillin-binding transpeptidase domain-containing protein [Clostridia bacterium]
MAKPKVNMKKRIIFLYGVFVVLIVALVIRTGYLQFISGGKLKREAIEQQTRDSIVSSSRGTIYDRNYKVLAQSASTNMVCVVPVTIRKNGNAEEISKALSEILEIEYDTVYKKTQKNSYYEIVKRRVETDKADKIRALNLEGIRLDDDTKRYYPNGSLAAHVIGFTGDDNQGLGGIEKVYDHVLGGVAGRIISAKSADGSDMPYEYEQYMDPVQGSDIVLTIDETIQHFTEKHLETAVAETQVQAGAAAIVMNPKTGEILAMATKPDYDLNQPMTLTDEAVLASLEGMSEEEYNKAYTEQLYKLWRNKAVVDTYEPGSTFKTIVASMALEENVVQLNDSFVCNGSKTVSGINISCANRLGHGVQTFVKGVHNSCNPVFMEVGERIGVQKFREYYKSFGFGATTGFELPGEAEGIFFAEGQMKALELATSSFGQGFNVTPLQMITAVSAIANGGYLMKPYIVKQINDENGNVTKVTEPTVVRQVISSETSRTMCSILEGVVSEGGGKNAYIKGYRLAGKTGTSEKQPRGCGKYVASFIGFAPADDPQLVCIVILDDPIGEYYGSMIAAPVVGRIMEDSLRYLGVERQYSAEEEAETNVSVPNVVGLTMEKAQETLVGAGLKYHLEGEATGEIKKQTPRAGTAVRSGAICTLYTDENVEEKKVVVPDVVALPLADVNTILANSGLNFMISGVGKHDAQGILRSVRQEPAAGTEVSEGTVVNVEFRFASSD